VRIWGQRGRSPFRNRTGRCTVRELHRSFVGSRSLCARLRFLRMTTGNSRFLTGLSARFGMTSLFGRRRLASAAEAGLHFLRRFAARLKAAPFQNTVLCGTAEAVPFPVKVKIKIKVKGVGHGRIWGQTGRSPFRKSHPSVSCTNAWVLRRESLALRATPLPQDDNKTAGSSPGFQPDSE